VAKQGRGARTTAAVQQLLVRRARLPALPLPLPALSWRRA
jgi:hypothetical protein